MNRRRLLAAVGTIGALSVAGCSGGDGGGGDDGSTRTDTPTATPTETADPTATATRTETTGATATGGTDGTADGDPTATATRTETATTTRRGTRGDTVRIRDVSFNPVRLIVAPGTTVEWINEDAFTHNVISSTFTDEGVQWDYRTRLSQGGSDTFTFENEGVYQYYCGIHGARATCGTVLVGEATLDSKLPCE